MSSKLTVNDENVIHSPFDMDIDLQKGLAEYLWESLNKYHNEIAQIDAVTGRKQTYREFLQQSLRLAKALQEKGITSEDVVTYCCYNNMDYAITFVAATFLGARVNPVDITMSKNEIHHCLKLSSPQIVFCEQEIEDVIESAIKEQNLSYDIVVYDGSKKYISFEEFLDKYKSNEEFKINTSKTGRDTGCINYTSGTSSGLSKAAEATHLGLYYGGVIGHRVAPGAKTILIVTMPYWITNVNYMMIAMLHGLTRVIFKCYDKTMLCKLFQDYKVQYTLITQAIISDFINNPEYCKYDTSDLKYIFYAGSNVGVKQIMQLSKIFPNAVLQNGFGMTEIAGLIFIPNKQHLTNKDKFHSTVGQPNPGFSYKIVDPNTGKNLGPNEKGELRIKYPGVSNGYLSNPEATKEAFDEDGFFKTGDLVYYDENYFFYIVDRIKEIFKFKGYHISPIIIEDELLSHPDVIEAAAIGIPHEEFGELPMGVVVLKENAVAKEEELVQYVNDRLPDIYHLRAGVKITSSLPKTTTGKYKRNYLRDLILKKQI